MKQLLTECYPLTIGLCESEQGENVYKLKGLFHLAETKNANGRVYSRQILEREISKIMPMIKNRQVIGELDHPSDPMPRLQGAAHVISDLKMDGNKIFGVLEVAKTPQGMVLEGLIRSGVRLGISARGVGSLLEREGTLHVQEDYQLLTWDVVPNPSTPSAWLTENSSIATQFGVDIQEEELDLIEFSSNNQKIEEEHKIKDVKGFDMELYMRKELSRIFGG